MLRRALRYSRGYLAVALDGPVGEIEMTLPPGRGAPDYLVVRAGRFPSVSDLIVSTTSVARIDRRARRVYLRPRIAQLAQLETDLAAQLSRGRRNRRERFPPERKRLLSSE